MKTKLFDWKNWNIAGHIIGKKGNDQQLISIKSHVEPPKTKEKEARTQSDKLSR